METTPTLEATTMETIIARIKTLTYEKKQLCLEQKELEQEIAYGRRICDNKDIIDEAFDNLHYLQRENILEGAPQYLHGLINELTTRGKLYVKDTLALLNHKCKALPNVKTRIANYNKEIAEQMALLGITDI